MKHPTREEWMAYLYREVSGVERAKLREHLDGCRECQEQLRSWQGATTAMSEWKLPARASRTPLPLVRWAAAAAILALAAIGAAQILSLRNEVKSLRVELAGRAAQPASPDSKGALAVLNQQWEQRRAADQQVLLAALQKITAQQAQDYATLRKELETVAIFSEAGLMRAQNQISSLAATPSNFSDPN